MNKGQALISIIIPVYNKEEYLDACMESLVNQTVKEIEILLINDDSCLPSSFTVNGMSSNVSLSPFLLMK